MKGTRFDVPSIRTLIAFESVVRLGGVTAAARELNVTQPAISRYLTSLEARLGVAVFERAERRLKLTQHGQEFHASIQAALVDLHAACHRARTKVSTVTIACTQELSVLALRPNFVRLKRSLSDCVDIRILPCDYDTISLLQPKGIDIIFEYSAPGREDAESVLFLKEEVVPVAGQELVGRYHKVLSAHPRHWTGVPRLALASRGQGWVMWTSWFAAHGCDPPQAPVEIFQNQINLLEAAMHGDGIALGWNGPIGRYLKSGELIPLRDEWLATDLCLYATLTPHGRRNRHARSCLLALGSLADELRSGREMLMRAPTGETGSVVSMPET